jgi:hypothetical protein
MATNVRSFNGSTDWISVAAGGADSGWGTYLVIYKLAADIDAKPLNGDQSSGADAPCLGKANNASGNWLYWYDNVSTRRNTTITFLNTDGWVIAVVTKASGTVNARFHVCILSTKVWKHGDSTTGTSADKTAPSGWSLGARDSTGTGTLAEALNGDIYCLARWDGRVLGDSILEKFDNIGAIISENPTNLWILNQASTGTNVTDYMGTAASQDSIVGTTVNSGQTIPNFIDVLPSSSPVAGGSMTGRRSIFLEEQADVRHWF